MESNEPAPVQGVAPADSRLIYSSQGREAKQAFFQMMSKWFTEFVRTNPAAQQPPPPPIPQQIPIVPQVIDPIRLSKPPVDKIRKHGLRSLRLPLMMMLRELIFGSRILSEYSINYLVLLMSVSNV